jgi:hypothetical protein
VIDARHVNARSIDELPSFRRQQVIADAGKRYDEDDRDDPNGSVEKANAEETIARPRRKSDDRFPIQLSVPA